MKLETTALIIVFTIMNINYVIASGRHGHHYNNHYGNHRHQYKNHYRGHGHYSYGPRRYYSHYDSHGHYAAYALGGLIVGSVLGATLTHSYNNPKKIS